MLDAVPSQGYKGINGNDTCLSSFIRKDTGNHNSGLQPNAAAINTYVCITFLV